MCVFLYTLLSSIYFNLIFIVINDCYLFVLITQKNREILRRLNRYMTQKHGQCVLKICLHLNNTRLNVYYIYTLGR